MKKGFLLLTTIIIISAVLLTLLSLVSVNLTAQRRAVLYQQNRQELYNHNISIH